MKFGIKTPTPTLQLAKHGGNLASRRQHANIRQLLEFRPFLSTGRRS